MDLEAIIIKTGQLCHQYYNSEFVEVLPVGNESGFSLCPSALCVSAVPVRDPWTVCVSINNLVQTRMRLSKQKSLCVMFYYDREV